MTRTVLLIGASGQVGTALARRFENVTAPTREQFDLTRADPDSTRDLIRASRADILVNCAAYTAVDRAEGEAGIADVVNGSAVGTLASAAAEAGTRFVTYSTDYVFDGTPNSPMSNRRLRRPDQRLRPKQAARRAAGSGSQPRLFGDPHLMGDLRDPPQLPLQDSPESRPGAGGCGERPAREPDDCLRSRLRHAGGHRGHSNRDPASGQSGCDDLVPIGGGGLRGGRARSLGAPTVRLGRPPGRGDRGRGTPCSARSESPTSGSSPYPPGLSPSTVWSKGGSQESMPIRDRNNESPRHSIAPAPAGHSCGAGSFS